MTEFSRFYRAAVTGAVLVASSSLSIGALAQQAPTAKPLPVPRYQTPGLGRQQVRLAYVLNLRDLDAAMTVLEQALLAYPGRVAEPAEAEAATELAGA